jgi:hypothetical protein
MSTLSSEAHEHLQVRICPVVSMSYTNIRSTLHRIRQDYNVVRSPDLTAVTANDLLMPLMDIRYTPDIRSLP